MSSEPHDHCSRCGAPLPPGVRYCVNCGAPVGSLVPLPPPPPRSPSLNRASAELGRRAESGAYWVIVTTSGRGDLLLYVRSTVWRWLLALAALAVMFVAAVVILFVVFQSGILQGFSPATSAPVTPVARARTSTPTSTATPTPTFTLTPTVVPTATSTAVPRPTRTAVPPPTRVPPTAPVACTNDAAFVADVTILDGTLLKSGQAFVKTWRLKNTGTCVWDSTYALVFTGGEQMSGASPRAVPPTARNATADISISMIAPSNPGKYTGQWSMRSPNGAYFGAALSVNIFVSGSGTPTVTATSTACNGTPNIISLTASPSAITVGQPSTLTWGQVTNASSVSLEPGFGAVESAGSRSVSPQSTTTYTLLAVCGVTGSTSSRTVTVTVNPAQVFQSGTLSIAENQKADLDAGALVNAADPNADIQFQGGSPRGVVPQNGATLAQVGTSPVGKTGCISASLTGNRINVPDLLANPYVCVLTNQGRYSQFHVNSIQPNHGPLNIDFTTWQ